MIWWKAWVRKLDEDGLNVFQQLEEGIVMRVSDCHEGLCKPGIDQVDEPEQEADFVYVPTRQHCNWVFSPDHEHVALDEREWCIDYSFPPGIKGHQIEVYSM